MLYTVPDVALQYWYLYTTPLTIAAFVFGLRGALLGSIVTVACLTLLFFGSVSFHTQVRVAASDLLRQRGLEAAAQDLQQLLLQAANLAANDPRTAAARATGGLLIAVLSSLLFGVLSDRGRLQERLALERAADQLKRYFSPQLVHTIIAGERWRGLATLRKEITVVFADLRGFTSLTERLQPEELGRLLNEYLSEMTQVVFKYDGTLDKYIGDAVMAFFGDPVVHGDDAERAVRAAIEMRERFQRLRGSWAEAGLGSIDVGIGLNTGYVTVGNIGSPVRMEYTVIGSAVNVGSRLADAAAPGQILTTLRTISPLRHLAEFRLLGPMELQGVPYSVEVVEVLGLRLAGPPAPAPAAPPLDLALARAADDEAFRAAIAARPGVALKDYRLTAAEQEVVARMASLLGYPLFRGVPGRAVVELVHAARRERFATGTVLGQAGLEGRFCVVSLGEASLHRVDDDGRERHLATLGRGASFGPPFLHLAAGSRLTVRALSELELLTLESSELFRLAELAPALAENARASAALLAHRATT